MKDQYGALPYRIDPHGDVEVLLVTSRETRRWVIPKGWSIKKLSNRQTAAREAFEEAGIIGKTLKNPVGSFQYEKRLDGKSRTQCRVSVFLLLVTEELEAWPEMKERERRWFSPSVAAELVQEEELSFLLRSMGGTGSSLDKMPDHEPVFAP